MWNGCSRNPVETYTSNVVGRPGEGTVCPGYLWQKSSNAIMVASEPRLPVGVMTGTDQ